VWSVSNRDQWWAWSVIEISGGTGGCGQLGIEISGGVVS